MSGLMLPGTDLPKTQVLLMQMMQQNQAILNLLEVVCRATLGQTADEVGRSTGITFPVVSEEAFKKAIEDAAMATMDAEADDQVTLEEAIAAGD